MHDLRFLDMCSPNDGNDDGCVSCCDVDDDKIVVGNLGISEILLSMDFNVCNNDGRKLWQRVQVQGS